MRHLVYVVICFVLMLVTTMIFAQTKNWELLWIAGPAALILGLNLIPAFGFLCGRRNSSGGSGE